MAIVYECDRCGNQHRDELKTVEVLQMVLGKFWQKDDALPSSWGLCKACIEELRMFMESIK